MLQAMVGGQDAGIVMNIHITLLKLTLLIREL